MARRTLGIALLAAYPAWLTMLALHEFGHALHAWLSGGAVRCMAIPLLGFSFTDVAPNPSPGLVAWGGPIWGCLLPPLIALAARGLSRTATRVALAFAGFCLIANGAYLAFGVFLDAGDAADMLRLGVPLWTLVSIGAVLFASGLSIWHCLTLKRHSGAQTRPAA